MRAGDWQRRLQEWCNSGDLPTLLPEISALEGVLQPAVFHAEGDALTHTMMAVATVRGDADERVFWAVLLHDVGKAVTTKFIDGRWRSHGHVNVGAEMVFAILDRLNLNDITEDVTWLVKHHHFAFDWGNYVFTKLTPRQKKFCEHPLFPLLIEVCRADVTASVGSSDKGKLLDLILSQLADGAGGINDQS